LIEAIGNGILNLELRKKNQELEIISLFRDFAIFFVTRYALSVTIILSFSQESNTFAAIISIYGTDKN
jgi:hypothetical protein